MRKLSTYLATAIGAALISLYPVATFANETDWPGWRGPNHDGKSTDTGLLTEWPDDGPTLLWKVDGIGTGYSSVAVTGGLVYATGNVDDTLTIFAFDMDGEPKWKTPFTAVEGRDDKGPRAKGSRATPATDEGNLYLMSNSGVVGCFDARSGDQKWTRDVQQFRGKAGTWGYAESVLIYNDWAIFKPGGKKCIVAIDKFTGETVWTSSGFKAGPEYSSCLPIEFEGHQALVTGTSGGLVCVDASNGKLLWMNDFCAGNTANCPTPVYADGYVFWSNGYGRGSICMKLKTVDGKLDADVAWTTKDMICHHGGYIIHEGYIYGNHSNGWSCLDLKTGELQWKERAVGKGSLCFADGMLYLFKERDGQAGLATCSPEGMELKGTFEVQGSGSSWAHPVVVGGRLYLRYAGNLYCFDVASK
jgi:outer membrane protein assembly factor BamB